MGWKCVRPQTTQFLLNDAKALVRDRRHQLNHPKMKDLYDICPPKPCITFGEPSGEVLCWGSAVYDAVKVPAYHNHRLLSVQLARDYKPENLWITPPGDRLAYPYSIFSALGSMFATEKDVGHKADWFLWTDDDVEIDLDGIRKLVAAAHPKDRPFVALVGYDRFYPFPPAVYVMKRMGDLDVPVQWVEVPKSGVHKVYATGLCCAIFHRSLFDILPEPWFATFPPRFRQPMAEPGNVATDSYWCDWLYEHDIPAYVCCDAETYHLGKPIKACRETYDAVRNG